MRYSLDRKHCAEYISSVPHKQRVLFVGYFLTLISLVVVSYLAIWGAFSTLVGLLVVLFFLFVWIVSLEIVLLLQEIKLIKVLLALSVVVVGLLFVQSIEVLIGVILFATCCAESFRRVKHERKKSIDATIGGVVHPLKHILPLFSLGVCVLLASSFVAVVITPDSTPERPISKQVFNSAFEPIEQGMQFVFSDYDSSLSIDEVRELVVQDVFGGQWFEDSANATNTQQDTRSLKEYLYETINDAVSTSLISFLPYVSIFGVIGLFIILRLLFIVMLWISYLVSYLVIKLLLRYGIILIQEQPSTQQHIQFT